MRIAISGTHQAGKTTLAEALTDALPGHRLVPEPYRALEDEGHEFGDMPSLEDFELMLARSCESLESAEANLVFDRCPLDVLAYLQTHEDAEAFTLEPWLPRIEAVMATLDLVVFVPIEQPDRVAVPRSEAALRAEVDDVLRAAVLDDAYDLELPVLEVAGAPAARLQQVMAHLAREAR